MIARLELIVAQAGEGGVGKQCVVVRPGQPAKGIEPKLVYEVSGPTPYVPTPVGKGTLLFLWGDSGIVSCLDAPTGKLHCASVWAEATSALRCG